MDELENEVKKNKTPIWIIGIVAVLAVASVVYWIADKPARIRSGCNTTAVAKAKNPYNGDIAQLTYQSVYNQCLESHGQPPPQAVGVPVPVN